MTIEAKIRISADAIQALQSLAQIAGGMQKVSAEGAKAAKSINDTAFGKSLDAMNAKVIESTHRTRVAATVASKRLQLAVSADAVKAGADLTKAYQDASAAAEKAAKSAEQRWRDATAKITADLDKVRAANSAAAQGMGRMDFQRSLGEGTRQAQGLAQQLEGVVGLTARLAAGLVGLASIRSLGELSDTYTAMTARLRTATRDQQTYNTALAGAKQLAEDYQRSLAATAQSLQRTYAAIEPLGGSIDQASQVTEAVLASLKISGATAEESASALLQFSQALSQGVLNGEEFNAVSQAAPALLQALADGLKVPRAALKEMGSQGKLTTSMIVEGLTASLPELRRTAEQIPATISSSVQQVKDATLVYVGESDNAKAATQSLIQMMGLLAENIGPVITVIGTLATLVGVTYVARAGKAVIASAGLAAQQLVLAAAARSAATEMGITAVASRGLVASIAGPAGLVLALASLAAGWAAVSRAKRDAISKEDLIAEREAIEARIEDTKARLRKGRGNINVVDAKADINADRRQIIDINAQIERLDAKAATDLKKSLKTKADLEKEYQEERVQLEKNAQRELAALSTKGTDAQRAAIKAELSERLELLKKRHEMGAGAPQPQLVDPAAVMAVEREFKTRESIEKDYADKRASYIKNKDKEIELARSKGALDQVKSLEAQKSQVLLQIEKSRAQAIDGLDKDSRVTRLAQAREMFDAEAALHEDALQRAAAANEEAYQQGMVSFKGYLSERARLEDAAIEAQVNMLRSQQAAQKAAISQNEVLAKAASTANERLSAEDAIARSREQVQRIEVDIAKLQRDQADNARRRTLDESSILDLLRKQREELDQQLRQATGTETPDSVARRVRSQYEGQLKGLLASEQDPEPLFKLIDVEIERAKFQLLQREFQDTREALYLQEQQIEAERDAGLITEANAEQRILDLRRQSLATLRDQAKAMADQSAILDKTAGKPQAREAGDAAQARTSVTVLGDLRDALDRTARSSAVSSLQDAIVSLGTQAKSTGEILKDMVGGFATAMLNVLAKRMAEKLVDQLMGAAQQMPNILGAMGGGSGGGFGGVLSSIGSFFGSLFHSGGVPGQGSSVKRSTSAAGWSMVPRFHTGYTPPDDLMPGELRAIIKTDEEVLTADNPRHIKNFGKAAAGVSIRTGDVIITAAQGSIADLKKAGDDLRRTIDICIDDWAVKESRPGGILVGGR